MKQKRDDACFDKIWRETCEKASESGIELSSDERTNRRVSRPPAVQAAYVTDTITGTRSADGDGESIQARYRGKLFAVVDELISELDRRFTTRPIDELLNAMVACDPQSFVHVCRKSLDYSRPVHSAERQQRSSSCSV